MTKAFLPHSLCLKIDFCPVAQCFPSCDKPPPYHSHPGNQYPLIWRRLFLSPICCLETTVLQCLQYKWKEKLKLPVLCFDGESGGTKAAIYTAHKHLVVREEVRGEGRRLKVMAKICFLYSVFGLG